MSRSKDKGTRKERQVAEYLSEWFPDADRDAQRGARDEGDIRGVPDLTVEVKYRGPGKALDFPGALREAEEEAEHGDTPWWVAMVHRSYKGVDETYCVQPLRVFAPMYHALARARRRERRLERVLEEARSIVYGQNREAATRRLIRAVVALEQSDEANKRGEGENAA